MVELTFPSWDSECVTATVELPTWGHNRWAGLLLEQNGLASNTMRWEGDPHPTGTHACRGATAFSPRFSWCLLMWQHWNEPSWKQILWPESDTGWAMRTCGRGRCECHTKPRSVIITKNWGYKPPGIGDVCSEQFINSFDISQPRCLKKYNHYLKLSWGYIVY